MPAFQTSLTNHVAGVSNPIIVESQFPLTVTIIPGMGSAKVQYSTSGRTQVSNGTANWLDWPYGMVGLPRTDGLMLPITALRLFSSADATLEVVG